MKRMTLDQIEEFVPPKHFGIRLRELVGPSTGAAKASIRFGDMDPGGYAEEHVHPDQEQTFYVLSGKVVITTPTDVAEASPGEAVMLAEGEVHQTANGIDGRTTYLVITAPA